MGNRIANTVKLGAYWAPGGGLYHEERIKRLEPGVTLTEWFKKVKVQCLQKGKILAMGPAGDTREYL